MKLNRDSSNRHIRGAKEMTDTLANVFRAQLMASFSIVASNEALDSTLGRALDEFLEKSDTQFQLPPAMMLDFMDNNVATTLDQMQDARSRIADRCVEMLGVTDTTLTDADLTALLDQEEGDQAQ
ncbi:unnamed protein product [marine sediment metagenome]|uniref:Uncharacterized protein n=1 Tax=marine sediment metagenome TaxID=412755 RepID=X1C7U4_9ZZZZ